jgi:hypothetical protein
MPDLAISYRGEPVKNLTVSKVFFWNRGADTMDGDDISDRDSLRVLSKDVDVKLLDAHVLQTNSAPSGFSVTMLAFGKAARPELVFESDVRPVMGRIQQAAYDVLFNKALWHDADTQRREVWIPTQWVMPDGELRILQQTALTMSIRPLDAFKAFPLNLTYRFAELPADWWFTAPESFAVEVLHTISRDPLRSPPESPNATEAAGPASPRPRESPVTETLHTGTCVDS